MTFPVGGGLLGAPSSAYISPFLDFSTPGTRMTTAPYDAHTELYYQNGVLREVFGERGNGNGYYGWCDYTVYPGGWAMTHTPGYHWFPNMSGYPNAYFQSRVFAGATRINTSTTAGPTDTSWLEYLGVTAPWPGHESHTGGSSVSVPTGDLEMRRYMRMRRVYTLPKTVYSARLYRNGGYPDYAKLYDIYFWPSISQTYVDFEGDSAIVNYYLQQGIAPANARAEADAFSTIVVAQVQVLVNDSQQNRQYISSGIYLNPELGLDLGFKIGDPNCMGDGNFNQWYCNLDAQQSDRQASPRYPADPDPYIGYLFCPYHLGLLFLDSEKFGYIPVWNHGHVEVHGVEMVVPTPPGWGWDKDGLYEWKDWQDNHAGPYPETMSYSVEGLGGVMHLDAIEPNSDDHEQYGYREIEVMGNVNDPAQSSRPSRKWAFEWVGYFTGSVLGVGVWGEGPELRWDMGNAYVYVHPGLNEIQVGGDIYPLLTNIDVYSMFHVRAVSSSTGWAMKVWQHGDAVPTSWTSWRKMTTTTYVVPDFWMFQDASLPYTTNTPVEVTFTCAGYTFWDLTSASDPLTFYASWATPPTGGSVDESKAPFSEGGGAAVPTRMLGSGNNFSAS